MKVRICDERSDFVAISDVINTLFTGEFVKAEEALQVSIAVSEAVRDFATLGLSMSVLGWALFCQGKFDQALALSEKMLDFGRLKDDARFINWGRNSKVRDLLALQRYEEAQELMRDVDDHISAEGGLAKFLNIDQVHFVGFRVRLASIHGGERASLRDIYVQHRCVPCALTS